MIFIALTNTPKSRTLTLNSEWVGTPLFVATAVIIQCDRAKRVDVLMIQIHRQLQTVGYLGSFVPPDIRQLPF